MSGTCLGDVAAALVDGELDHAARERAHRHLAHCAGCRAEVEGQRRLKARLSGAGHPEPRGDLTDRLLRLAAQLEVSSQAHVPSRPPVAGRPAARAGTTGDGRAGARPATRRRRATTGSAIALLGVAAALALGAPPPRPATTPVDPASDAFVTEFVSTEDGTGPAVLPPVRTARLTTFVPLTRSALLTTGGARTTR